MVGLVGDIGSTNARFALVDDDSPAAAVRLRQIAGFPCANFDRLAAAAGAYLATLAAHDRPRHATLALAGPVDGDVVTLTNHGWTFSARELTGALNLESLSVINDFAAISYSLGTLGSDDWVAIGETPPALGKTYGVIGPGTGLGVGGVLLRDGRSIILPSEGGHTGFAPSNPTERTVAAWLESRYGHVSNERLLSGPGLVNLYCALGAANSAPGAAMTPEQITPEQITRAAVDGTDPLCRSTLALFCEILGTAAGDLALILNADTIFIAGGIVPRFIAFLRASGFRAAFERKGRFADRMARIPTRVITTPNPGLLGAAVHLLQRQPAGERR